MLHLNHDAWAAIGQYLDPVSVYQLSSTCRDLHSDLSSNPALWRGLALKRWPMLAWHANADTVRDWHGLYKASHAASCQLATARPWSFSITRRTSSTPRTAHLLLSHALSTASSDCGGSTNWQSSTFVAAAVNSSVQFYKWTARADISKPFTGLLPLGQGSCPEPSCQHWCSDGHHEVPISAMLEVPTNSPSPGYATGLMDGTIKLWTPFRTATTSSSSSSSSSNSRRASAGREAAGGNPIRPSRTFTGHTDQISCLTCLAHAQQQQQQQQQHSVLVSGSADKTIRLWSLACVQQPSSSSGSSSSSGGGSSVRQGSQNHKQQASNPLLGTLRGHSSAVSSVLARPAVTADSTPAEAPWSSSSSCTCVLSGGQDGRVKLWAVDEARRACVATWRLPGPCQQLLAGLDMPGCAVVRLDRRLLVLDTRVPPAGSAVTQGELTLPWPSKGSVSCAAVRGNVVAAGGREGVCAWDLRMSPPHHSNSGDTAASSSRGSSSSAGARLLLSGSLPHVSALHLDSVKLVAASGRARLHSAAGITVWSVPSGDKVELYCSPLSGVCLHPTRRPYMEAATVLGPLSRADLAIEAMIDQLPEKQAAEAEAILAGNASPPASAAGSDSDADEEGSASENDFWGGSGSCASSESESGSTEAGEAAATAGSGSGSTRWEGCIEPGVAALSVQGPVIACVDSLGNFLLRDFTAGLPRPGLVQAFAAPSPAAGSKQLDERAAQSPGSGTPKAAAAAAAAVEEMLRLKFWRQ